MCASVPSRIFLGSAEIVARYNIYYGGRPSRVVVWPHTAVQHGEELSVVGTASIFHSWMIDVENPDDVVVVDGSGRGRRHRLHLLQQECLAVVAVGDVGIMAGSLGNTRRPRWNRASCFFSATF